MNMNQIRCVIVEDEPLAQKILAEHIELFDTIKLVGKAYNAIEARELIDTTKPDFIFLDINLPGKNGYDFLKTLPAPRPLVVVTSAHVEFALKGYELEVVDFLQKPIFFDKFEITISRVEKRLRLMQGLVNKETSDKTLWIDADKKIVSVRANYEVYLVVFEDIVYIESMDNYAKIIRFSQPSKPLIPKITLTSIAQLIPMPFLRIHRQYMVNTQYIQKISSSTLELTTGKELPIGKTYQEHLRLFLV